MTTPSQPGDDLKAEPEMIEDLEVPDDDAADIAAGVFAGGHAFGIPTPAVLTNVRHM